MNNELKRFVPINKVVSAAIVDTHEDIGKVEQVYSHWAARGVKKLDREVLHTTRRKVILTVNRSTNTATLPPDFDEETFVGIIAGGKKVPLRLRPELIDTKNTEEIPCEDKCEKCNQNKAICDDLTITETASAVIINDVTYEQLVTKKMYPDGSYYLETRIPVWDVTAGEVIYTTTKQHIATIDLKPCGCIEETAENIQTIQCCCPEVYNCYYAPCDDSCTVDYGGYKIFEETGIIQFDKIGKFTKVYIEYWAFLTKRNGRYYIPAIAFETLVEWVKYKSVQNRKSAPDRVIDRWFENYRRERSSMEKVLGRISLSMIIQAASMTPKFDIDSEFAYEKMTLDVDAEVTTTVSTESGCVSSTTAVCPVSADSSMSYVPFSISVISGVGSGPVDGINTYQNDKLKNAINVELIVVNHNNETFKNGDFTIDTTNGILSRWQGDGVTPNNWAGGDVLVIPTFFKLV